MIFDTYRRTIANLDTFSFVQERNLSKFLEDETRMLEEMGFNTRHMVTSSSHDPPQLLKVLQMHKVLCRLTVIGET